MKYKSNDVSVKEVSEKDCEWLTTDRPGTTCPQDDRHGQILVSELVKKERRPSVLPAASRPFHGEQQIDPFQTHRVSRN